MLWHYCGSKQTLIQFFGVYVIFFPFLGASIVLWVYQALFENDQDTNLSNWSAKIVITPNIK